MTCTNGPARLQDDLPGEKAIYNCPISQQVRQAKSGCRPIYGTGLKLNSIAKANQGPNWKQST